MVEKCTIRAPHDGFLIYANEDEDDVRIELGTTVRENQDLFFLPDLTKMLVRTTLHETIVQRVQAGMPARVAIEALPNVRLEGEVVSVAPLPMSKWSWRQADDVRNFEGIVELHVIPEGLLPGMTAEVEILTATAQDALVIPPTALAFEDGRDVCYVASPTGVERREVMVGQYNTQMIEITGGLDEGELVVTDPGRIDRKTVMIVDTPRAPADSDPFADPAVTAAAEHPTTETPDAFAASPPPQPTL